MHKIKNDTKHIGIVLSKAPAYSETFFNSKIVGLKGSGFKVTIFVQKNDTSFNVCNTVKAPIVSKHNPLLQFFRIGFVLLVFMIRFPKRLSKFIVLERHANRSWTQIIKNIYNNSHILKSNVDWLHFGFATMAIQSEHVAESINAKMGVSFRGFDLNVFPKENPNCYDILWKKVDKVHAISNYMLNKGYELGLSKTTNFSIITPAIDVFLFDSINNVLSRDSIRIVTTARLHKIKDIKLIIDAMVILRDHAIKFEYHIIGDGPEHDNLLNQIKILGLEKEVILVGKKSHSEVAELLKLADIYVQYSESEGFCNAVLEAQAAGLLCIVSDGGALPENVLHEQTGWVIPKKNASLLAQAIMNVIHLPDSVKKQIITAAQERIKNEFNLSKQQQLFKTFYEND